ncbi:MAG: hypothetical protein GEU74_12730, partial [Nitriliruptorales bacterium]|nr:hypothetical protein [Nitriliruptorales bacterium]
MGIVAAVASMSRLFGLFPDGRFEARYERVLLDCMWVFLVFPPIVLVARPLVLFPSFYDVGEVVNPYAVAGLAGLGNAAGTFAFASQAMFAAGPVLLGLRYRRGTAATRRRIRWLSLPAVIPAFAVVLDVVVGAHAVVLSLLYVLTMVTVPLSVAVALLRPNLLDVDVVLRKSLVYGVLWLVIAAAYVLAAASLGVAAGQRFSVGAAITLTVVATLVFQPARRRLEGLADRWVFGARTDPARLVTRLGAALEETVELERLLPRMAATLEEGLGLRVGHGCGWSRSPRTATRNRCCRCRSPWVRSGSAWWSGTEEGGAADCIRPGGREDAGPPGGAGRPQRPAHGRARAVTGAPGPGAGSRAATHRAEYPSRATPCSCRTPAATVTRATSTYTATSSCGRGTRRRLRAGSAWESRCLP